MERFLSQPFFVAEFFTNSPGQYVKLDATISGLTGLAEGDYDDVDEQAFYLIGDMSTLKTSSHGEATGKSLSSRHGWWVLRTSASDMF